MGRRLAIVVLCRLVLIVASSMIAPSPVQAGGGPENVLLVVNARSWSSLTVANHYVRLRKIPAANVFYLDWAGDNEQIDLETFRAKLLGPILVEIERRGIADHIDYVVYSTDFPWAVDCSAEAQGKSLSQYLTPIAALNGATFLYQDILTRRLDLMAFDANQYFRAAPPPDVPASHGFRSWYGWGKNGKLLEAGGERYFLSTLLGVTTGRGCSTADVVKYLTRSVGADFTKPAGTIYYAQNDDVRATTRRELFFPAAKALEQLHVRAEIVDGVLPQGKADVMGAMIGAAQFSWRDSRSTIRPGAICEHLTSLGGVMTTGASQTPLTENLLSGAAGSSGAVTEPYAVPQKFPNAFIQLHYARGCSLAEAYYQSVNGPYQLLIVGDPLCRPWADPPRVSLAGVVAGATLKDLLTITPSAKTPPQSFVARYQLYIDGLLYDECDGRQSPSLSVDTRRLADGYHELRVMAVGNEPIETRGGVLLPITVANRSDVVTLERVDDRPIRWGEPLRLHAKSAGAAGLVLVQGSRTLAKSAGQEAEFTVEPRTLGLGPITLQAAALGGRANSNRISSPLELEVQANEPLASYQVRGGALYKPGMLLTQENGEPRTVFALPPEKWLAELGVTDGETFSLVGFFTTERDGEFQFQLRHQMQVALLVDDRPLYDAKNAETVTDYIPIALKTGLHKIEIRGRATGDMRLDVRYGQTGLSGLRPAALSHIPPPQ